MRRMLDQKELGGLGGGGDEKLYCHCISIHSDSNQKGGYLMLNYYSKKKDRFTYETFKKEFSNNRRLACSGYIHDGDNYFTAFYLELGTSGPFTEIYVRYNDTVRNIYDLRRLNSFTLEDSVSEVK